MFKLYDVYEDAELIGQGDLDSISKMAKDWIDETDGECSLIILTEDGEQYDYWGYMEEQK